MSVLTNSMVHISIGLNATEAEDFARAILHKLEVAREQQALHPDLHWNLREDKSPEYVSAYYVVTGSLTVAGIHVTLEPDKRHPDCSGYCHY